MAETLRPAAEYDRAQMNRLLQDGAAANGTNTARAAVHLLVFTRLPGTADFAGRVKVELASVPRRNEDTGDTYIETVPTAWVQDWAALADSDAARRAGGGPQTLLKLAASIAEGAPVDLRVELPRIRGVAGVRRAAEALLIAAGGDRLLSVASESTIVGLAADRAVMMGDRADD